MRRHDTERENEFIALLRQHERVIYKVCSFYTSEQFTLDDLYQETVGNLWRAYDTFRGESAVSTWIYRIALNTCITSLRRNGRRPKSVSLSGLELLPAEPEAMDERV